MAEIAERGSQEVRGFPFFLFFPWDKNTLSWKSQPHGIIKVPQK